MFLPIPYKVQRVIATHINRLQARATLALKVASVLCVGGGQTCVDFELSLVAAVFPYEGGQSVTPQDLERHVDELIQVRCRAAFSPPFCFVKGRILY